MRKTYPEQKKLKNDARSSEDKSAQKQAGGDLAAVARISRAGLDLWKRRGLLGRNFLQLSERSRRDGYGTHPTVRAALFGSVFSGRLSFLNG